MRRQLGSSSTPSVKPSQRTSCPAFLCHRLRCTSNSDAKGRGGALYSLHLTSGDSKTATLDWALRLFFCGSFLYFFFVFVCIRSEVDLSPRSAASPGLKEPRRADCAAATPACLSKHRTLTWTNNTSHTYVCIIVLVPQAASARKRSTQPWLSHDSRMGRWSTPRRLDDCLQIPSHTLEYQQKAEEYPPQSAPIVVRWWWSRNESQVCFYKTKCICIRRGGGHVGEQSLLVFLTPITSKTLATTTLSILWVSTKSYIPMRLSWTSHKSIIFVYRSGCVEWRQSFDCFNFKRSWFMKRFGG